MIKVTSMIKYLADVWYQGAQQSHHPLLKVQPEQQPLSYIGV